MVFMKIRVKYKVKFIQAMIKQLKGDLKVANLKCKIFPKNQRKFIDWHKTLEGATIDSEAQKSRQKPFYKRKCMEDIAKEFMIDLGIGYESRSKKGQFKTANRYTIRLNLKKYSRQTEKFSQ